jgi:4-hydroxy-3-polyprenylbenzoate decarboxylase
MDKSKIIIAVTGASGSIYARLLCAELAAREEIGEIALIFTANGREVAAFEDSAEWASSPRFTLYDNGDMFSPPASGSAGYDSMVVIPCSMGMAGRIAGGISDDLVSRAADVMLKERRTLIIVPRETPVSTIHLRNLTTLSECGAIVCPASPSFYSHPAGIEALCRTVTERIFSLLGLDSDRYRWEGRK